LKFYNRNNHNNITSNLLKTNQRRYISENSAEISFYESTKEHSGLNKCINN